MEELPRYVEECFALKEKYQRDIDIRVGLEGDYIEGYEEEIGRIVEAYPWDYVIGSVHFLGAWDISDERQLHEWEHRDVDEVYAQYYDAVQKAAKTGFYDFLGHLDVIKRFGKRPRGDISKLEEQTLRVIKEADIAIELNASGLRMPVREMFPSRLILEKACQLGIPVTIGSDAHTPERLAQYLDQARALLKEIGFGQLATFRQRRREMIPF
jgi:histidinol-phosphatase (PHP family)